MLLVRHRAPRHDRHDAILTGTVVGQGVGSQVYGDLVPGSEEVHQSFLALIRVQLVRREKKH